MRASTCRRPYLTQVIGEEVVAYVCAVVGVVLIELVEGDAHLGIGNPLADLVDHPDSVIPCHPYRRISSEGC